VFGNPDSYKHKLVAMGDSMAQGFKNGGIYRTDLSFPAILARCFKPGTPFDAPSFAAHTGLPLNIEMLVREIEEEYGPKLTWNEYLSAGTRLYRTLRRVKNHWEGSRVQLQDKRNYPWHLQAVWGYQASDAWLMNERKCREFLLNNQPRYSVFSVLPDNAMYITSRVVLNPTYDPLLEENNMLDNVRLMNENGGIENLICCLGHNNIVGSITNLKIVYSEPEDLLATHSQRKCTAYRPEHFEQEMDQLFKSIAEMNIPRVFVPTIPYLTIPPVIRGVNEDRSVPAGGYFDYYTRFWIWDEDFDPLKHPHLTREQAIELDMLVDQYNSSIKKLADRYGFNVVPVRRYVSAAARRRLGSDQVWPFPPAFVKALKENPNTQYLVEENDHIRLSTDFLRLNEETGKIDRGGIFSLDGMHPSTIGYGLIANIYHMTMAKAGVKFEHDIDWNFVIENETLITHPPALLSELRLLLRFLSMGRQERITHLGRNVFQQMLDLFSSPDV